MENNFNKLSDTLANLISSLKEFEKTKNDYKKPYIRAYLVEVLSLAKIIGGELLKHTQKLLDDIDSYLSNPEDEKYLVLINDAIKLQNDLWEI